MENSVFFVLKRKTNNVTMYDPKCQWFNPFFESVNNKDVLAWAIFILFPLFIFMAFQKMRKMHLWGIFSFSRIYFFVNTAYLFNRLVSGFRTNFTFLIEISLYQPIWYHISAIWSRKESRFHQNGCHHPICVLNIQFQPTRSNLFFW